MGLLDSLRWNKKEAETVTEEEKSETLNVEQTEHEVEEETVFEEFQQEIQENLVDVDEASEFEAIDEGVLEEQPESELHYAAIKSYSEKAPVTHVVGQTKIIGIINQKGGVGKSTTAVNLSAALGEHNKQVLLVDLDPQGNATSGLGVEKGRLERCVYDLLLGDVAVEDVIIPDVTTGVDIIPATINLAGAEVELVNEFARENRLKEALGSLRGKYDYIFIDCPPSLGLLTINAFVAADKLLIPIQCEFYALEGVTKLLDSMKRVKSILNPSLDIYGVLMTMYDGRTTLSKQVAEEVNKYFGKLCFKTYIPRAVKISEAPSYGEPITQYDPDGKGSKAYKNLAEEVIERG